MANNKPTDEFLEKLATSRVYPLDRGYIIVGDDLVAMARELQERRKADSTGLRGAYGSYVVGWDNCRDFVIPELINAFSKHIITAGLCNSDSVTVLECKDALQHVADQYLKEAAL
ncbi:MAG: hypothetical protein RR308_04625 [Hafnia sp.]